MLAATFPNADLLNDTIQSAVDSKYQDGTVQKDGHGHFDVTVYPGDFDIASHTYPGETGSAPGLKTREGDVVVSAAFLDDSVLAGENALTHEFAHCVQSASRAGGLTERRDYPTGFPNEAAAQRAFAQNPALQQLLLQQFGKVHEGAEQFPTLETLFRYFPEKLKAAAPDVYRLMVRYFGFDPLPSDARPVRGAF